MNAAPGLAPGVYAVYDIEEIKDGFVAFYETAAGVAAAKIAVDHQVVQFFQGGGGVGQQVWPFDAGKSLGQDADAGEVAKICLGAQFCEKGADEMGQVEKNTGPGAADQAAANEDVDALLLAEGIVVNLVAPGQFP